jgi:hypothetical protein
MVAGAGDPLPSSSLFVHGDSPCLGEMWSAQGSIVFDKFKLTNNRCTIIQGQTCLHSMHKYLPKVLVVPLSSDQIHMSSETLLRHFEEFGVPSNADEFVFPETAFITVTAYQNQQVSFRFRLPECILKSAHTQFFSSKQRVIISKIDLLKGILGHGKSNANEFVFPNTAFITVTAFQNQHMSFRFRLSKYFLKSSHNLSRQNNS